MFWHSVCCQVNNISMLGIAQYLFTMTCNEKQKGLKLTNKWRNCVKCKHSSYKT